MALVPASALRAARAFRDGARDLEGKSAMVEEYLLYQSLKMSVTALRLVGLYSEPLKTIVANARDRQRALESRAENVPDVIEISLVRRATDDLLAAATERLEDMPAESRD